MLPQALKRLSYLGRGSRRDVARRFVAALVKHLPTPGVEINRLFRLVRDDVLVATGRKQEPFTRALRDGKDGETKSIPARYSFTFVNEGNDCKIVDHHSSAMPAPPKGSNGAPLLAWRRADLKRVLRAVIRGAELCAAQPEGAAQRMVDGGFTKRYDFALQAIKDLPYARWRDYDAEDTIRYYVLPLYEAKMVKRRMAQGTDS